MAAGADRRRCGRRRAPTASTWSRAWGQWNETTLDREGVPAPDGVGAIRRFRRGRADHRRGGRRVRAAGRRPRALRLRAALGTAAARLPLRGDARDRSAGARASAGCRRSTARTPWSGAIVRLVLARFIPDTAAPARGAPPKPRAVTTDRSARRGPLAGIRVVDLTRARGGPHVRAPARRPRGRRGRGAEPARRRRVLVARLPTAPTCTATSAPSPSTSPPTTAAPCFFRLVEHADVLVENFRPGVKHRLGIDPDAVWAVNPRVVYATISGFGQTGPYASRPGRRPDRAGPRRADERHRPARYGPWRVGIAISDTAAGTILTQGVLAALHRPRPHRARAVGAHVAARGDGQLHGLPGDAVADRRRGAGPGRQPAPDDRADGRLSRPPTATSTSPRMGDFAAFCALIGAPELADDPRYADVRVARSSTAPTLDADLGAAAAHAHHGRVGRAPRRRRARAGPVLAVDEVFADPQVQHLAADPPGRAPDAWRDRGAAPAAHVLRHAGDGSGSGPPADGAHTREVLAELGYDDAEIDDAAHERCSRSHQREQER